MVRVRVAVGVCREHVELTYGEFDARVNRLCTPSDFATGCGSGVVGGVGNAPRSVDLAGRVWYAVVKAGGGYVPVDPNHQADRIEYGVDHSQRPVCVRCVCLRPLLKNVGVRCWRGAGDRSG